MKKMILALVLLWVVVFSVVSCSCDCPFQDCAETTAGDTSATAPVTTTPVKPNEPVYDTDEGWGPLVPMKPVK